MSYVLDDVNVMLSLGVAMSLYLIGLAYISTRKFAGRSFLIRIYSFAFAVRLLALFSIYFALLSLGGDGYVISDDRSYNLTALEISDDLKSQRGGYKQYDTGYSNIAYFNFNGFLYHHMGFDTLTMRVLNGFFGSIVIVLIYQIMLQLFDQRIARLAAIMVAVVPNMIFWSVSQVKDPLIIFSTFSIIYILICKLHSGRLALYFIPYCAFMYMLWHLRKDFCFPLIAISILWILFRYTFLKSYFNNPKRAFVMKFFMLSLLAAPLFMGLASTGAGSNFLGTMNQFNEAQKNLASPDSSVSVGFSRYLRVVSPADFYKLPPAMAFTAIAPLPALAVPSNPFGYGTMMYSYANFALVLLMPFVVIGFIKFKSPKLQFTDELLVRWLPFVTLASISIIYLGNLRYKASIVPYFLMWAAVGWSYRKKYRGGLLLLYGFITAALVTMVSLAVMFR